MSNKSRSLLGAILIIVGILFMLLYYHFIDSYGIFGSFISYNGGIVGELEEVYLIQLPIVGDIFVFNTNVEKYILFSSTPEDYYFVSQLGHLPIQIDSTMFYINLILIIAGLFLFFVEKKKDSSKKEELKNSLDKKLVKSIAVSFFILIATLYLLTDALNIKYILKGGGIETILIIMPLLMIIIIFISLNKSLKKLKQENITKSKKLIDKYDFTRERQYTEFNTQEEKYKW